MNTVKKMRKNIRDYRTRHDIPTGIGVVITAIIAFVLVDLALLGVFIWAIIRVVNHFTG